MKRLALLLFSSMAFGQGVILPPQQALKVVNGITSPVSNATITVCAANVSGIPCAPALVGALFKDAALTQPLTNPFTSDANGNYSFAMASGTFTVTVSAATFVGYSYQITVPLAAGASLSFTGSTTFSGPANLNAGGSLIGTFSGPTTFSGNDSFTGVTTACQQNAVLYVGGSIICWSGSDIGAQINTAYAALPSAGGTIILLPQTGGGCYNFSTPITFTTLGKYAILQGNTANSNNVGVNGGACINYTPTTATAAITIDVTPPGGGGYSPGGGLRDLQVTNNGCITAGGCGSSAVGVNIGPSNGGCHRCMFSNVKVSGFGTGYKINDIVGWGLQWVNASLVYNTTGLGYTTTAHENDTMTAPAIAVNGTGVSMGSGSNVELSIYGGSSDGNTGTYFSNGGGQLYLSDHHFENTSCVSEAYISNAGNTKISGGEMLEDCSTSSVAQLITQTAGQLDLRGVPVFSGGRTVTNFVNISGGAATVNWSTNSPTLIPASGNSIDTCSVPARCIFSRLTTSTNQWASFAPFFAIPASTLAGAPPGIAATTITWTDPSSDGMWKYNPGNNGEQHVPQMFVLTSAYTNATTGFTTVTPFSFPVSASKNYTFSCHLFYQAAATGGLNIQFTGPASPTFVTYGLNEVLSASTFADSTATAFGASLGSAVTTATTNFDAYVSFGLINGANAGTVVLQAKSSAAVNLTIQPGSFCQWQ